MPNTSDQALTPECRWRERQRHLISSLRSQPLLVVLRPSPLDWSETTFERSPLFALVERLVTAGVQHVEVAWDDHPRWPALMRALMARYPDLHLGVASVVSASALQVVADLGVAFAMSPCLDFQLIAQAREQGQLLVPGVFSPSEIHQAAKHGCDLVKLFPAETLGIDYLSRLSAPMGKLPHVIAAGGLKAADLEAWLAAGYLALALGRGVINDDSVDANLISWLM